MLDISFYTANGKPPYIVEVAKDFLVWLSGTEFFNIGKSVTKKIFYVEGEEEKLPLVRLSKNNRRKLRNFLLEAITQESDAVLTQLGDSPSKQEYQGITYRLKKLQELRKCVENENYQYLQRV